MDSLSFVGSSLLSPIYGMLSEKLKDYLSDQLSEKLKDYLSDQLWNSNKEVHLEMEDWKILLPKITTVLQHAEENQVANQFVKLHLDDLKDLAYDMEDILEEFVIDAKRSKMGAESEARPSKLQKIISSVFFVSRAKPNPKLDSMVNDLSGRLQKIHNGMCSLDLANLALKLEDKSHIVDAKRLPESSLLENIVLGRDSDKEAILQRLLEDGGNLKHNFVIPIVGMGGLGKTTLARLIYNDKTLEGKFDFKAWVCVSDEFDVAQITRTILEHVTREKCVFDDFNLLQEELKGKLSGRKFFLVLDDVWNKDYGQWDVLKKPFMSGAPGSKIIVTTRNKDVGMMMRGDDVIYKLEPLQDDACLPLFTLHALGKNNFDANLDLQDAGEKLVKRCKRLPLALKTLGGVLQGKLCPNEWENILNSDIWSSSEDSNGILPTLRLSYNHLPCHLKRCFAYCALFPKDYEFCEHELVLLWMAEGLLQQQSHGKKQMEEDTGHQYFQELLSRSLFQQSSGAKSRFVMHDLINDLAIAVAGEIHYNLERDLANEKLKKARHLSFTPNFLEFSKRFTVFEELKQLRTFLSLRATSDGYSISHLSNKILHDFLPTLNRLRVLSLYKYQIRKVPNFFGKLKHIRYIDLSQTQIECLPESVGSLLFLQTLLLSGCHQFTELPTTIGDLINLQYIDLSQTKIKRLPESMGSLLFLQTLLLSGCQQFIELPTTIGDLINLHHLVITDTPSLEEMPLEIGNLKNLVTLSKFIVGKASGMMMKLFALKNLSQLRGGLSIVNLENVSNVQDAVDANLDKIHGLKELVLEWGETALDNDRDESNQDESVLCRLKPPSNLKSLEISLYGGTSFPDWVCNPSLFSNLSSMELSYCDRCTSLPSLGLLPALRKLLIEGMEAIEVVGHGFYGVQDCFRSLEELVFNDMQNWKEWTPPNGSEGEFPCLRRLVIKHCPKLLGQLPWNLSSLKELDVIDCNAMLLKSMGDLTSLANLRIKEISELTCLPMSVSLPSLKKLSIRDCNGVLLKSMVDLTSLTDLKIVKISELTCLPKSFTKSLIALETLNIVACNDLTCLWEEGIEIEQRLLPFNLKHLSLRECRALESLPDAMMMRMDGSSSSNSSMLMLRLETLEILHCDSLKSFPRGKLPISLQYLSIVCCKGLESLPEVDGDNNNSNLHLTIHNVPRLYSFESCHQPPAFLKEFRVTSCDWLESFPERMLQHCTELQSIYISGCKILKSLPTLDCVSKLVNLHIESCEAWESLPEKLGSCTPNLKDLKIFNCKNFKSLPNTMHQLKSLQTLRVFDCPCVKFIPDGGLPPNLTELLLKGCKNLQCVPNTMYQLRSLQWLVIPGRALKRGLQNLFSLQKLTIEEKFPLDIVLPSSLTFLEIVTEENLESIPGELFQNLSSLTELNIKDCPKLRSLPKEAFPPLLGRLFICWCPHLKRQWFEEKGDYWTLTWDIPDVMVSSDEIFKSLCPRLTSR